MLAAEADCLVLNDVSLVIFRVVLFGIRVLCIPVIYLPNPFWNDAAYNSVLENVEHNELKQLRILRVEQRFVCIFNSIFILFAVGVYVDNLLPAELGYGEGGFANELTEYKF